MSDRYEWDNVHSRTPLLLLPIRIETRLTPGRTQLKVRIYPDDIHVDRLGHGLSAAEQAAAARYWRRRWTEGDDAPKSDRWQKLVDEVGPRRAAWAAALYLPKNYGATTGQPVFPSLTPQAVADRVRAALMPERFWVLVHQFEWKVKAGARITQAPALGPKPGAGGAPMTELAGALSAAANAVAGVSGEQQDPELKWLTDYAVAEAAGMAVTVDISPPSPPLMPPVQVVGVSMRPPSAAAAEFCRLLHAHAHSDGFEFLATGAITNNTAEDRTTFSRAAGVPAEPRFRPVPPPTPPPPPPAHTGIFGMGGEEQEEPFVSFGEPQPPEEASFPPAVTPAAALSHALGVDVGALASLDDPDRPEQDWAAAFNTALWPITWAPLFDRVMAPTVTGSVFPEWARKDLKDHAIGHVRGRGPLPSIRVGRQPYGILPTSNFAVINDNPPTWKPDPDDLVDVKLSKVVPAVRKLWAAQEHLAPTVTNGQLDRDLPRILAMQPTSRALRIRQVLVGEVDAMLFIPDVLEPPRKKALRDLMAKVAQWSGYRFDDFRVPELVSDQTRMLRLPLAHDSDPQVCADMLDGRMIVEIASVLQALLGLSLSTAQAAVDRVQVRRDALMRAVAVKWHGLRALEETTRVLDHVSDSNRIDDPLTAAWAAFVAEQAEASNPWSQIPIFDPNWRTNMFDPVAFAARYTGAPPHPIDVIDTPGSGVTVNKALSAAMRAVLRLLEIRRAIRTIGGIVDTPDRILLTAETIDCASYRVDAWQTSRATRRLAKTREEGDRGVAVGVYGWVYGIDVENAPSTAGDGGYVLAPSLAHSATAAVLRGAALTHDPEGTGKGPLNIDLSSTRVREALAVLDGVRAGQPLGALLGYRLERWLHEDRRPLDRFIYLLRSVAPLVAAKDTDRTSGVAEAGLEAVSVNDVVDGIRILELCTADPRKVRLALKSPPAAYAKYLQSFPPVEEADLDLVFKHVERLRSLHDAIADVLLSESVHQLLRGSPTRAAAAADVLTGDGPPPPIEVTANPTEGSTVTHRVLALLPPVIALSNFWPQTARSEMHPHIERWAQTILGSAREITLSSTVSMTKAGLSATDVVVLAGGTTSADELWQQLARRISGLGHRPSTAFTEAWVLAGAAFRLLGTSRAATPDDLRRPSDAGTDPGTRRRVDLHGVRIRLQGAHDALEGVLSMTDGAALVDTLVCQFGRSHQGFIPEELPAIVAQNRARLAAFEQSMASFTAAAPSAESDALAALADMAALLFDDRIPVVAELLAAGGDPFIAALRVGPSDTGSAGAVAEWLHRCATVRPDLSRYTELHLLTDTVGRPAPVRAWQLPSDALPTWVGAPFRGKPPEQPVTGLVVDGLLPARDEDPIALLVLDAWSEVIPRPSGRHTLGLAINANGPNARAPQALLLAVNPDTEPWSPEKVGNLLSDVVMAARQRALTLEEVPLAGRIVPATSLADWSLQGEPVLDVAALVDEGFDIGNVLSHISEEEGP
ncbi:hypothetical protein [Mycolicibacterium monacense]|uniref:hypothetical protein n=1 Tax=Mycolicibacterium monacense TaxID=85693 RepID=UPI0007EB0548|nr:hypothetical protein [Mycolicibacterium monacense]OBF48716.1 hypothetical protein A5778_22045 [Mycolicibacterium monacense]